MNKLSVKSNSGQALLVILLIMAVVLTIGLATISRSITDIKISEQTDDSARAFSAAEAGIEAVLSGLTDTSGLFSSGTGTSVTTRKTNINSGSSFLYPEPLSKNEIATVWLSEFDKTSKTYKNLLTLGQMKVGWGNAGTSSSDGTTPALEVSIYYRDGSDNKVAKYMLDPKTDRDNGFCKVEMEMRVGACTGVASFDITSGAAYGSKILQFNADLDTSDLPSLLFARLRLLYNNSTHDVGLSADSSLPKQGELIEAVGQSNQATRKVEVYRLNPAPPDIFDFALYSGGGLVK